MVGWPLLSSLILLLLLQTTESVKCHGMLFKEDAEFMNFCEIAIEIPGNEQSGYKVDINNNYGWDCTEIGCEHEENYTRCCCQEDYCNTVSFALRQRADQELPRSTYYLLPVIAVVLLTKYLLLLLITNWDVIKPHKDTFPKKMHVDLTRFAVPLNTRPSVEPPAEMGQDGDFVLDETNCLAVISYGCDDNLTIRETNPPTMADYGLDEHSTMEEILDVVMKIGPKEIAYDATTVIRILQAARGAFRKEPTLLRLNPPIAIYADMHGQYSDLWRWFQTNGWPNKTKSIFLGDYVDRGRHSTEVYLLLSLLKVNFPMNMFMLRGNHEDGNVCRHYTFFNEISSRFVNDQDRVFDAFEETFCMMPMSALIGQKILCMHGGLTPCIETLAQIEQVQRPTKKEITKDDNFIGLLWSDPVNGSRKFKPNVRRDESGRGIGYMFGKPQIRAFCHRNNLSLIVRGHQPPMHGYERFSSRLITVFSAPGYRMEKNVPNLGSSLLVDAQGQILIIRLAVDSKMTAKRQKSKMNRGSAYVMTKPTPPPKPSPAPPKPSPAPEVKASPEAKAEGPPVAAASSNSSVSTNVNTTGSKETVTNGETSVEPTVVATSSNSSLNAVQASASKENISNPQPTIRATGSNTLVSNSSLKVSSSKENVNT